jgi:CheY-like chemotaxis protein
MRRRHVRDLLTSAGYELIEAVNGEEALTLVTKRRPDLILMDIQLSAGCDDFVAMPYSPQELLAKVRQYLPLANKRKRPRSVCLSSVKPAARS